MLQMEMDVQMQHRVAASGRQWPSTPPPKQKPVWRVGGGGSRPSGQKKKERMRLGEPWVFACSCIKFNGTRAVQENLQRRRPVHKRHLEQTLQVTCFRRPGRRRRRQLHLRTNTTLEILMNETTKSLLASGAKNNQRPV